MMEAWKSQLQQKLADYEQSVPEGLWADVMVGVGAAAAAGAVAAATETAAAATTEATAAAAKAGGAAAKAGGAASNAGTIAGVTAAVGAVVLGAVLLLNRGEAPAPHPQPAPVRQEVPAPQPLPEETIEPLPQPIPAVSAPAEIVPSVDVAPEEPQPSDAEPIREETPQPVPPRQEPQQEPVPAPQHRKRSRVSINLSFTKQTAGYVTYRYFTPAVTAATPIGSTSNDATQGEEALEQPVTQLRTRQKHFAPSRFSATVSVQLDKRWSLETGLTFTTLRSEYTTETKGSELNAEQSLFYAGLPLHVSYTLFDSKRFRFYLTGGGTVEKVLNGSVHESAPYDPTMKRTYKHLRVDPLQFSLQGSAGVEIHLNEHSHLFLQPGVSHHFDNTGSVPTLYRYKPTEFEIKAGVRFLLK